MNSIILSIGDELVLGQTVDTNSAWISQQLAAIGCDIAAHMTVPDDQPAIERAMRDLARQTDFLICSGGIGPTPDDLTRQALAVVLNVELETSDYFLQKLVDFFKQRGRPMPEMNRIQAMIPRGTTLIDNTAGTAAGIDAVIRCGDGGHACRVFVMPGVPKEMKAMFTRDVLPHMREAGGGAVILSRTLHTFGLGESAVAEKLGALMDRKRQPSVGTTVSNGFVSLRIDARYPTLAEAQGQVEQTDAACRAALGDLIFGQDEQTLVDVIAALMPAEGSVATAEQGTGGLLGKMLTDALLSERFYRGGTVTPLDAEVNEHTARESAGAIQDARGTTFGIAVACDAGGETAIAIASADGVVSRRFKLAGDRPMLRDRAAKMALMMLRHRLLGREMTI